MKITLKRENRLLLAKSWIKTYTGKNIVKGYSKKFSVDILCAIKELRMIGVETSVEYENQLINSIEAIKLQRVLSKKNRDNKLNELSRFENDENFAVIIGYTSGGYPYGLTYEPDILY